MDRVETVSTDGNTCMITTDARAKFSQIAPTYAVMMRWKCAEDRLESIDSYREHILCMPQDNYPCSNHPHEGSR